MTIEALVARYGLAALFLGAGVEGETVVVLGGIMVHRGALPYAGAIAAAAIGSFVADQLFFAAGRRFRDHPRVQRMQARPAFTKALAAFERRPTLFVFAFRFLYGLRTVSPVAIGTTRLPTARFMALNAIAAAVWATVFVSIGYWFGHGLNDLIGRWLPSWQVLAAGGAAAALVLGVVWVVRLRA
ncbi:DedA family protein [Sphingomonas sp. VNH70]|uniref:DedA family protein n=1 Tax=Sphingomonas silueang TaxID=3156617 RepID=UPI0032B58EB7